MQILLSKLMRPWGIEHQMNLLSRWLESTEPTATIVTSECNNSLFNRPGDRVRVHARPWQTLNADAPTLVGPYPATTWAIRGSLRQYCVVLPHIPWGLYPKRQRQWIGHLPVYEHRNSSLIWGSLRFVLSTPIRWFKRCRDRRRDQKAVRQAREVLIYDERIRESVQEIYDRDPLLITPMATPGRAHTTDPGDSFVGSGPFEPAQNWHHVIDGYSLFVHRLGQTVQTDWEKQHPLEMWQQGTVNLAVAGSGRGKDYLNHYVDIQNLSERVRFEKWPAPARRQEWLRSAVACIDLPLTGDASSLIYEAISMGVPGIYSRRHRELDRLLKNTPLAIPIDNPRDENAIGRALLTATKIAKSERKPNPELKRAVDPENRVDELLEIVLGS